ncbi:MAG: serine protease [Planctomycetes bacterium]|nr:serine protease [Planctomycetota bacterium]
MRIGTAVIWGVCFVGYLSHAGEPKGQPDFSRSVVRIVSIYQERDYLQPWQRNPQEYRSGSGCILSRRRILTNAHVVSDAIFTRVLKSGEGIGYRAKVLYVAHDCDLAMLTVEDERFWKNTEPLTLGKMPKISDHVAAYGFPIGGDKLSVTNGIVSRIEFQEYINSNMKLLAVQIDAALNAGNSGGPVMKDGRIVGIGFQGISAEVADNIGYMIPPPIVDRFLRDLEDGAYNGVPSLSIRWQAMENPTMQTYYNMGGRTGVLVTGVSYDGTLDGHVHVGDVLLSVDGHKIDNDGMIPFNGSDRICFEQVAAQKQINVGIDLEVLRSGNVLAMKCLLRPHAPLVPSFSHESTYYIAGGLIFLPLTRRYVRNLLADEKSCAPALEEMLQYMQSGLPSQKRRQVVVLANVLPDDVNFGYQDIRNAVVAKIDGQPVRDLEHLVNALNDRGRAYHLIELSQGQQIILGAQTCGNETGRIITDFGIPATCSDDLKAVVALKRK